MPNAPTDGRYVNRERSWLEFDERVLALAEDPGIPLLERVRFLAIFARNLDEFVQVRVAGLREQIERGVTATTPDGLTPAQTLDTVRERIRELTKRQSQLFHADLAPALDRAGIRFSNWDQLDDDDRGHLVAIFRERVFPVLTPLAVDPAHPFPYISNLSMNLAVFVGDPATDQTRFARVKVPPLLPRFLVMPDGERFIPLEQVIAAHLDALFPGMDVIGHHTFRVTRNADLVVEEEEADDLLLAIETELTRQRFGRVVRLEVEPTIDPDALALLTRELDVGEQDVYTAEAPLDVAGLSSVASLDRPDLTWPSWSPVTPSRLAGSRDGPGDLFATIRHGDVLIHHPYESFTTTVQAFIEAAAADPDVLAIKQTLYRTGPESPTVRALIEAARQGKQVVALVELKARFDEETNIEWARALEEAGVHVVYGLVGLKTHTKTSLVVRAEGDRLRRYAHIGTGNYNDETARTYEDLGLLTADPDLGADLADLFNYLTGYSRQDEYRALAIAPVTLRHRIGELIEREAAAPDGSIVAKVNALVDASVIDQLYAASATGTSIDLIVRGICCLRAQVPGLSDNIRVRSIVGRFLEHSRVFRFGSPDRGYDYLIGSADLMPRNLYRRVEAVAPIRDPRLQARVESILQLLLADDVRAWELHDDVWQRVPTTESIDAQAQLAERAAGDQRRPVVP